MVEKYRKQFKSFLDNDFLSCISFTQNIQSHGHWMLRYCALTLSFYVNDTKKRSFVKYVKEDIERKRFLCSEKG